MLRIRVIGTMTAAVGLACALVAAGAGASIYRLGTDAPTGAALAVKGSLVGTSDSAEGNATEQSSRHISGTVSGFFGGGTYSGTLTNVGFLEPPPICFGCAQHFAVEGTVTFSTRAGTFTAGVVAGSEGAVLFPSHFVELDYDLVLHSSGGTRWFAMTRGDFTLTYTSLTQEGGPGCIPVDQGGTCGVPFDTGSLTGAIRLGPSS
jgi:hypothetical protein